MKKRTLTIVFASLLLLTACNTAETNGTIEKEDATQATAGKDVETDKPSTEEDKAKEEEAEQDVAEQQVEKESDEEAKPREIFIYGGDENFETVVATETVNYTFSENGNITKFLVDQLSLSTYYNKHTVSSDEKTITLDLNEEILFSNLVQGSAGASIFADSLAVTFFKNIPTLESLNVRVNGKEEELDHTRIFTGTVTRADVAKDFPELVDTQAR